jgi:hypothetical protein
MPAVRRRAGSAGCAQGCQRGRAHGAQHDARPCPLKAHRRLLDLHLLHHVRQELQIEGGLAPGPEGEVGGSRRAVRRRARDPPRISTGSGEPGNHIPHSGELPHARGARCDLFKRCIQRRGPGRQLRLTSHTWPSSCLAYSRGGAPAARSGERWVVRVVKRSVVGGGVCGRGGATWGGWRGLTAIALTLCLCPGARVSGHKHKPQFGGAPRDEPPAAPTNS